jgi:hypothetical protein
VVLDAQLALATKGTTPNLVAEVGAEVRELQALPTVSGQAAVLSLVLGQVVLDAITTVPM